MRSFVVASLLLLPACLFAPSARAKSSSWWDCFFREFENCSGRVADPEGPSADAGPEARKSHCDSGARVTCDEEEAKKIVKGGGVSANQVGKPKGGELQLPVSGKASQPGDAPAPGIFIVEGEAPSGFHTVLGIDVSLPISDVAAGYKKRNVRGCRPIEDPFTRVLCLDAPGASLGPPVELEFYRGRLVSLNYEANAAAVVKFRPAVAVAEENTGASAALSSRMQDPQKSLPAELQSRYCLARFALAGGTLTLHGLPASANGDPCDAPNLESASLVRVDWAPPAAVLREIGEQRKSDRRGSSLDVRKDELERTRRELQL